MTTDDAKIYIRVANSLSMTTAASELHLAKSKVSRVISDLESDFGVVLLERTTRSMRLTEAGRRLLERAIDLVETQQQTYELVRGEQATISGVLRVSASLSVGQYIIAPALTRLTAQYPDLRVELKLTNRRVDLIEEGFDIALRVGELADSRYVALPFTETASGVYASLSYLKSRDAIRRVDDMVDHAFWSMGDLSSPGELRLVSNTGESRVAMSLAGEINDFTALGNLAKSGAGLVLLPKFVARSRPFNTLVRVLPAWRTMAAPIRLVVPSRRGMSRKTRAFIEVLKASYA